MLHGSTVPTGRDPQRWADVSALYEQAKVGVRTRALTARYLACLTRWVMKAGGGAWFEPDLRCFRDAKIITYSG